MRQASELEQRIAALFDRAKFGDQTHQDYFANSGFSNLGYWSSSNITAEQASRALVDRLFRDVPRPSGRVLDVACGQGGTTKRLGELFGASQVVGINLSDAQVNAARVNAPGSTFHKMSANELAFGDESFDHVVCVEAAFHFETRERFLREVLRILRPGGTLLMTDILFRGVHPPTVPRANSIHSEHAYQHLLSDCGYSEISLESAFDVTVKPASRKYLGFCWSRLRTLGRSQLGTFALAALEAASWRLLFRDYLLVAARKPLHPAATRGGCPVLHT